MPGPLAQNRLRKSPFQGKNKKITKHMRRVARMLEVRRANAPKKSGFHTPGSQNLRKSSTGTRGQ